MLIKAEYELYEEKKHSQRYNLSKGQGPNALYIPKEAITGKTPKRLQIVITEAD